MKRTLYYILLTIGILGLINTISLLFYVNINVGTLFPGLVGSIFITYAIMKLWFHKDKSIINNIRLRRLIIICVTLFSVSFILIESLIILNNNSQQNVETKYLIILGAGLNGETISLTLKERLDKGLEYLNQYPDTTVIVSGGQGIDEKISEAEAMKRYLIAGGIVSKRIIKEDKSSSTMENFRFSKKVILDNNTTINSQNDIVKIMIITNDFHMLRSKMLAKRTGYEPYGITCDTPISVRLNNYAREYFALIKSYILDK